MVKLGNGVLVIQDFTVIGLRRTGDGTQLSVELRPDGASAYHSTLELPKGSWAARALQYGGSYTLLVVDPQTVEVSDVETETPGTVPTSE